MLEETGVPYIVHVVDLAAGEHKTPAFLAINATGRIPAIVDDDAPGGPLALAETLAIALYLCEKSGRLMPGAARERARAWQWAATVISGFGAATPGIFFAKQLGESEHAKIIAKFHADIVGYLAAMDSDLAERPYLAGETFSFADALAIPAIALSLPRFGVDLTLYPAVERWRERVQQRAGVQRGFGIPAA
jgi:GST-like protein